MKKLIALLIAMVMVFSLAACGANPTPAAEPVAEAAEPAAEAEASAPVEEDPYAGLNDLEKTLLDASKMTDEELYAKAKEERGK